MCTGVLTWVMSAEVTEAKKLSDAGESEPIGTPTTDVGGDRVTGAGVVNRNTGAEALLTADLVVDETGKGFTTSE